MDELDELDVAMAEDCDCIVYVPTDLSVVRAVAEALAGEVDRPLLHVLDWRGGHVEVIGRTRLDGLELAVVVADPSIAAGAEDVLRAAGAVRVCAVVMD